MTNDINLNDQADNKQPCSYCGTLTDGYHSGAFECGRCWTFRKLDGPASSYWEEKLTSTLSNIDFYDLQNYLPDALGDSMTATDFLTALIRVKQYSTGLREAERIRRGL